MHLKSAFLILLLFLLPAGCGDRQEPPPKQVYQTAGTVRIGLLPELDIFSQKERYDPLANYLSRRTGAEVELHILSRYGNIIDNFVDEKLDGAFFGSFTGALAVRKLGVEPLARPVYKDGRSTYYGMILVRKDSGIATAEDMRGKRFAFVDKATTAGWLLPLHYFQEIGIPDYRLWFSETYFAGTHEDVILDVLNGLTDIGAAKNTVYDRLAADNGRLDAELKVLAVSPEVPANGLAVRKDLADSIKGKLKATLLQMNQDPEGILLLEKMGFSHFTETTERDYQPVFGYADTVGLDLISYDYLNQ